GGSRSPVVYACEWNSQADGSGVRVDNESGGRLAVEHLLALGHTDIGFVLGPQQNPLTGSRKDGALAALHQAGLNLPAHWALSGDFTLDSGAKAAQDWAALPVRPTAMFCMSDQMAFGFIAELTRLGYAVPDDVSVVGFDDIEIAHYFTPGLTTIRQPRFAVGCEAAKLLTCALQKEQKDEQASHTVLPVELIVRATTAAREGT
ncbi:substrate-binding domain-containing protein, partial [Pseudovibrio axinellae]